MISAIVSTLNDERRLGATLSSLVPAAMDAFVREVIVADQGSIDQTLEIAEAKFRRETAELFEKFYEDRRAKEIMASGKDSKIKREELITLMFGQRPGGPKRFDDEKEAA